MVFFAGLIGFFVPPVSANPGDDAPAMFDTPPRLESSAFADSGLDLDPSILIETDIDATGSVEKVNVVRGNVLLSSSAANALKRWKFTPFTGAGGKPVRAIASLTFDFHLQSGM